MIDVVKNLLEQTLENINSGNSTISPIEKEQIAELFAKINKQELNKLEAAEYLGISKTTFETYIKKGLIPKGYKRRGSTLLWDKKDLIKFCKQ